MILATTSPITPLTTKNSVVATEIEATGQTRSRLNAWTYTASPYNGRPDVTVSTKKQPATPRGPGQRSVRPRRDTPGTPSDEDVTARPGDRSAWADTTSARCSGPTRAEM